MSDRQQHHSRVLAAALERIAAIPAPRILDLGPAHGTSIAFLTRFGGSLTIADLRSDLLGRGDRSLTEAMALASARQRDYHLILAWDLFDYLEETHARLLGRRLAELSRPGTLLFCVANYRETMPLSPRSFRLHGDTLIFEEVAPGERRAPRLQEGNLARLLPGYAADSGVLLQNGLKEILMQCRESAAS